MGREAYLNNNRIQTILAPVIHATYCLKPEKTIFPTASLPETYHVFTNGSVPVTLSTSQPGNKHTDTLDGAPTPPPGAGTRPPNPRRFPMSRYGLPSYNRNITGGIHILTIDTQTRNNAPPLDRDIRNPPSHEGRIITNPTPVDI